MPFTALISDLHLTAGRPAINRVFFSFLEGPAREADALYILGDLVFRVFDRVAYALVMEAARPVNVLDAVTNP